MLESQINEILDKARSDVDSLNNTILVLRQSLQNINVSVNDRGVVKDQTTVEVYSSKNSLKKKITYFLKENQRFLHNREIAKMIMDKEPDKKEEDLVPKTSSVLSRLKSEGFIINKTVGKSLRNTFWGTQKWLDEKGEIKPEHIFNSEYYFETIKEEIDI